MTQWLSNGSEMQIGLSKGAAEWFSRSCHFGVKLKQLGSNPFGPFWLIIILVHGLVTTVAREGCRQLRVLFAETRFVLLFRGELILLLMTW